MPCKRKSDEAEHFKKGYRFAPSPTERPPVEGDLRVTTLLDWTGIAGPDGHTVMERLHVGTNVIAAPLTGDEQKRLRGAGISNPGVRLEVHGREDDGRDLYRESRHCIRLIALFVRMAPRAAGIVMHRYNGSVWEQHRWPLTTRQQLGVRDAYNYIPTDRAITTWPTLIEHWPAVPPPNSEGIYRALDMYFDSVAEARDKSFSKSLLTGAVAFDLLLGPGIRDELRYRMSTRGALLVAQGAEAACVAKWLRDYYDVRSGLVHAGKAPTQEVVDAIHQYFMRALPSMFMLASLTGGHAAAAAALDMATFGERRDLDVLMSGGWWSYVDSTWLTGRLKSVSLK